jgi:hypothetical protein
MSNKVKYFSSVYHTGMPTWVPDTAGSVLAVLQACLVDGFNTQTITSITRTGQVATVTTSVAHNYVPGQTLLLSATGEALYNGEKTIDSVPSTTTYTFAVTGSPGTVATGSCKVAPLGWVREFTDTNKAVYRSPNVVGTRMYYRFHEPATLSVTRTKTGTSTASFTGKAVYCEQYDSMSTVDVGVERMVYSYIQKGRGNAANTTTQHIKIIGDDRCFWILMECEDSSAPKLWLGHFFGDPVRLWDVDPWSAICGGFLGMNSVGDTMTTHGWHYATSFGSTTSYPQFQFAKAANSIWSADQGYLWSMATSANSRMGVGLANPCPIGQGHVAFPVMIGNATFGPRAWVPGLYNLGWAPSTNDNRMVEVLVHAISTPSVYRRMLNVSPESGYGIAIDLTGPWHE